uniref:Uncharacterized protein n=1 Tax=Hyaloperonospora arabidopsidis (strain Emoy2) TaxID=559515 RepID=M4BCN5_HYAAE
MDSASGCVGGEAGPREPLPPDLGGSGLRAVPSSPRIEAGDGGGLPAAALRFKTDLWAVVPPRRTQASRGLGYSDWWTLFPGEADRTDGVEISLTSGSQMDVSGGETRPESRTSFSGQSAGGGGTVGVTVHAQRSEDHAKPRGPVIVRPPRMSNEQIFEAVTAELRSAPEAAPREAWKAIVAALFAAELAALNIPPEREPSRLIARLVSVVDGCTYAQWCKYSRGICRDLYNSTWSLSSISESATSKVKWARKPVLNQWAATVTGTRSAGRAAGNGVPPGTYETYMSNPAKYPAADKERLMAICAAPVRDRSGPRLRAGTDDERKILRGLAEGDIVCRGMPPFLIKIFSAKDCLRFQATIQVQVEGELSFSLVGAATIHASRQHTQSLQEDMLLAAEGLKVNLKDLHCMLSQVKTISYNHAKRSIHLFFFTPTAARKFQCTVVPFRRRLYRLHNPHAPSAGSVWNRQVGVDGKVPDDANGVRRFCP